MIKVRWNLNNYSKYKNSPEQKKKRLQQEQKIKSFFEAYPSAASILGWLAVFGWVYFFYVIYQIRQ